MDNRKKYYVMGGSILGAIIFLLLCMMILSSCSSKGSYSKLEEKLIEATSECVANGDVTVPINTSMTVTSDQLIEAGYLKSLDKYKDDGCTATVLIMNNNDYYNYVPYLYCDNYKTMSLKEKIVDDNLSSSDDGLYYENGEYIFKGNYPNNIVFFNDEYWLIIKIDNNGNLKLLRVDSSKNSVSWDTKFNENTGDVTGENDYKTSDMREQLNYEYEEFNEDLKSHLIPFDACIGKRPSDRVEKNSAIDCSEKLNNQFFGLINPSDYANASYDKDCIDLLSGSCINYNYLFINLPATWTYNALADDTHEVIIYSSGRFTGVKANKNYNYNAIIYISGNERYIDGDGSVENPYIIK